MNLEERRALNRYILNACVKIASSRGYSDAVGVLRGTLFLADEPMDLDALADETGYSKTTVRTNIRVLENQGLVRRVVTPGDKRYRYILVTDQNSLRQAMLANMKSEIQMVLEALDLTQRCLPAGDHDAETIREKISSMKLFYRQSDQLLDLLSRYTAREVIELLQRGRK